MKLSIVIPSYNYARYLPEAIESVLCQNYSDFELIIVDDASTDGSQDIAHDYASRDRRIQVIQHKKNQGLYSSVSDGFKHSQGYYFHAFSSDDKYLPGFLDKTLKHLELNPRISLCYSDCGYFYDSEPNHILTKKLLPPSSKPCVFSPKEIISFCSKRQFMISGHTAIVKKASMEKYGFYNPKLYCWMDWFLFHSIALSESTAYIPETLCAMRLHPNTYTSSCLNKSLKNEIITNVLSMLDLNENFELKNRFKKSALLGCFFKSFQALRRPKFWSFYPPLIRKYYLHQQKAFLNRIYGKN